MKRLRAIAAVVTLAAACAALLAPAAGAAEPFLYGHGNRETAADKLASESVLRVPDLPAGFVVGYETSCGYLRDASENEGIYERREHLPPNPSEAFLAANKTGFCSAEYERLYRAAGTGATPMTLTSFALVTPSAAAAAKALSLGAETFEYQLDVGDFAAAGGAPAVGEEARLFHSDRASFRRLSGLPGSLLLWRQGSVVGGVFAVSMKATVSDAAAAEYAARQQAYLLSPRPYLTSEAGSAATYLENPNLKVPVYWLGSTFEPKGLESSYFERALGPEELIAQLPGRELSVQYSDGPTLDTWTPSGWAKFSKTATGRRQWSWHCTRSESIKLPEGHAIIYAAYKKDYATCPHARPHHFSAHVFLPGVVIAIGDRGELSAYESRIGLKAIVRSLRRYSP